MVATMSSESDAPGVACTLLYPPFSGVESVWYNVVWMCAQTVDRVEIDGLAEDDFQQLNFGVRTTLGIPPDGVPWRRVYDPDQDDCECWLQLVTNTSTPVGSQSTTLRVAKSYLWTDSATYYILGALLASYILIVVFWLVRRPKSKLL